MKHLTRFLACLILLNGVAYADKFDAAGNLAVVEKNSTAVLTSLQALDNAVSGNEFQVDIVSAPTLTVNSHAVTNAGTFAVQAAQSGTWTLGANSGVDIGDVTLTASTNNIGDVDILTIAAGNNNIGDVDVASIAAGTNYIGKFRLTDGTRDMSLLDLTNSKPAPVAIVDGDGTQITSFGGGTQYTEDAAAAANPVGTALNLVRADSLAGVTTTDGDNVAARGTDKGELYVKHVDAITVTGVATAANQSTGNTSLSNIDTDTSNIQTAVELIDDTIDTDNTTVPGTLKGALIAGTDGTNTQVVSVNSDGEIGINDGGNAITIDVASGGIASGAISSGALASGSIASGALASGSIASGALASGSIAAGAIAAGATSIAENEDVASNDGERGVKILGVRRDAPTAAVIGSDNEYGFIRLGNLGNAITSEGAPLSQHVRGALTSSMTGTTSTSLISAGGASLKIYVTQWACSNGHATQGTYINLQDGNAGTALASHYAAPGGGFEIKSDHAIAVTTAATALYVVNVTTGSDTRCSASGYLAP